MHKITQEYWKRQGRLDGLLGFETIKLTLGKEAYESYIKGYNETLPLAQSAIVSNEELEAIKEMAIQHAIDGIYKPPFYADKNDEFNMLKNRIYRNCFDNKKDELGTSFCWRTMRGLTIKELRDL